MSFMFKPLHQLLVTQERLSRTNPTITRVCKARRCTEQVIKDLGHALVTCEANNGAGLAVMECLRQIVPGLSIEAALRLDVELEESMELPFVWLCAAAFNAI